MQVELELFQTDRVDEQGDLITHDEAQKLVQRFAEVPVSYNFDPASPKLGKAVGLRIEGNKVMVTLDLERDGLQLVSAGAQAALGAVGDISLGGDQVYQESYNTLYGLQLTEVALTHKKARYLDERGKRE